MEANPPAQPKRRRGRPAVYATNEERKQARLLASRRYQAKQRQLKADRQVADRRVRDLEKLQSTTFIDLSALGYHRPK